MSVRRVRDNAVNEIGNRSLIAFLPAALGWTQGSGHSPDLSPSRTEQFGRRLMPRWSRALRFDAAHQHDKHSALWAGCWKSNLDP